MNTAPGLIHKLDADIINIIHKRNTSSNSKSMPSIIVRRLSLHNKNANVSAQSYSFSRSRLNNQLLDKEIR